MSVKTASYVKGAAAGMIAGGLAFFAVKTLSSRHRHRRMTTAKAMKLIGTMMEAF